jgi:5-methylcytosine-specific restriction protein A
MHNPEWTRDELILGLDLYFRLTTTQLTRANADVIALSTLLNQLPLHLPNTRDNRFRNPTGVSMELRGFLRFDPHYAGEGLRGAKLGKKVWDEFSEDQSRLRATADAIRTGCGQLTQSHSDLPSLTEEDADAFPEGIILTRLHRLRERNPAAIRRKKERVQGETGRLTCEACGFDFLEAYGELGEGFAECHHVVPLSQLPGHTLTRLTDLAIVCANCHRMLHRSTEWLTIPALRQIIDHRRECATDFIGEVP